MSGKESNSRSHCRRGYAKVAPGLYWHEKRKRYYGRKKIHGRRKERNLGTSDRKIADRRFKEWIDNMEKVDAAMEKTTLRELIERFLAVTESRAPNTKVTTAAIIKRFEEWWNRQPEGLDTQVRNIRPSQLDEWLAVQELRDLRNTTYNRYAGFLKQLFAIAVKDRILFESPCKHLTIPWKKPQTPIRKVPTIAQFEAIIRSVRTQPFSDHAQDTADFLEFLGLAGVGQAEAFALRWMDIDWPKERINIHRQKTDFWYTIPIYPHLRPLLEKLRKRRGAGLPEGRVSKIQDGKKALASACRRLHLPAFSQRSLRQALIRRLWEAGVDRKLIAKWQGHRDGGRLIIETYTEVFGDDNEAYERAQIAKIGVPAEANPDGTDQHQFSTKKAA